MKKVVVSSLLAASAMVLAPGFAVNAGVARAQDSSAAASGAAAPAAGQVQMDPKEYAVYDNAVNKQTTPQTQAPALEAYLTQFPNSAVKLDVEQRLMVDYSSFDPSKAITTADQVLKLDPNNLRSDLIEVVFRRQQAETQTDLAARTSGLDQAAMFAKQGLSATKPAGMADADWTALQNAALPTFYSAIGTDDLLKKDYAGAIDSYKKELAATPVAATTQPGTALQDTYYLGQAYYQATPADYVDCTFYATRAYDYAPAQYQAQMPLASYCYKKYHGGTDGYDAVVAAAKANVNPPSGFTIVAAPSDADIAAKTVASTPDLATLALSDKEFILKNGTPDVASKVFDTIKGKTVEIPDAVVVAATADQLQVSVSDDAMQSKMADFTFNMKEPLKTVPAVGDKVTLTGTYASYTQSPVMIVMSDAAVVPKKTAAPARRRTTH